MPKGQKQHDQTSQWNENERHDRSFYSENRPVITGQNREQRSPNKVTLPVKKNEKVNVKLHNEGEGEAETRGTNQKERTDREKDGGGEWK